MKEIFLSRLHFPVTALGPGRRIGLWVQGCSIRCAGCISLDTWAPGKGSTTVAAVAEVIMRWIDEADGLTISGGEPLDQADAIRRHVGETGVALAAKRRQRNKRLIVAAAKRPRLWCGGVVRFWDHCIDKAASDEWVPERLRRSPTCI